MDIQDVKKAHRAVKAAMASHKQARSLHKALKAHLRDAAFHGQRLDECAKVADPDAVNEHVRKFRAALTSAKSLAAEIGGHHADVADHHERAATHLANALGDDAAPDLGPAQGDEHWDPSLETIERKPGIRVGYDNDPTKSIKSAAVDIMDPHAGVRQELRKLGVADADKLVDRAELGQMDSDERRRTVSKLFGRMLRGRMPSLARRN